MRKSKEPEGMCGRERIVYERQESSSCVSDICFHCMGMIRRYVFWSKFSKRTLKVKNKPTEKQKQRRMPWRLGGKEYTMATNGALNIY